MVPKAAQDAGYTAIGLGVLALQQVMTRRREVQERIDEELRAHRARVDCALEKVKGTLTPVTAQLDRLPRLPGPLGQFVEVGRHRLQQALRAKAS